MFDYRMQKMNYHLFLHGNWITRATAIIIFSLVIIIICQHVVLFHEENGPINLLYNHFKRYAVDKIFKKLLKSLILQNSSQYPC